MQDKEKVSLARQITGVFGLRLAHAGLLFVSSVAVARLLGPEGKGVLGLLGVFTGTAALLVSFGLPNAVIYRLGRVPGEFRKTFSCALAVFLALGAAGFASLHLVWRAGGAAVLLKGVPYPVFAAASLLLPAGIVTSLLLAAARGAGKVTLSALAVIVKEAVYLAALAAAVAWLKLGLIWAVYALWLAEAALGAWSLWLLRGALSPRDFVPSYSAEVASDLFSFGLKSYAASLAQQLNYRLDVFIVNYFLSPAAVGIYSVSTALSEALLMLPGAVCFALFPRISAVGKERGAAIAASLVRRALWLVLAAGGALCLLSRWLVPAAYGGPFAPAVAAIFLLAPGVAALSCAWVLGAYFEGSGRPQLVASAAGLGLAATVALDLLLIPVYGINGAAAASSVSYLASALWLVHVFRSETGVRLSELVKPVPSEFLPARILESLGLRSAA